MKCVFPAVTAIPPQARSQSMFRCSDSAPSTFARGGMRSISCHRPLAGSIFARGEMRSTPCHRPLAAQYTYYTRNGMAMNFLLIGRADALSRFRSMTFVVEKKGTARREMGNALLVLNHKKGQTCQVCRPTPMFPQYPNSVNKIGIMSPEF